MTIDLSNAVAAEFLALADLLDPLPGSGWDTPSLCEGWRVREVVAHMTMAARYSSEEFIAELQHDGGDFTTLSNRIASRDAELPRAALLDNLRDELLHKWTPPGGGAIGALNHVVIHGLDITVPLGVASSTPPEVVRAVLDELVRGGHFGFDSDGLELRATDMEWSSGSGQVVSGAATDLVLLIARRELPAGRVTG